MTHHLRIQNPFFNRQRITDPVYFFGRATHIEAIYSAIVTHQCRSLVGERKMGKSSLLTYIGLPETLRQYGLNPDTCLILYFDLEAMASAGVEDFWLELLDLLSARLPAGELLTAVQRAADTGEVRFMTVRRLLRRLRDAGFQLVLGLDEFEALARNPRFEPDFYGELRSLAGELGLVYLTASKRSLYELTYEHSDTLSSPFFNIFSELPLGMFSEDEARELLTGLSVSGDERGFCEEELAFALQLGGTQPFFLQIAGFYLYERTERCQPLLPDEYRQTHKRFLAEAEDHYRYLWSQLSPSQQLALTHLSQASEPLIRTLRLKSLVQDKEGHPIPFSPTFAEFLEQQREPAQRTDSTPTPTHLTGRNLGGYRVLSPLGQGGMAEVYQGYQAALDRYVAIKLLAPRLAADPTFYERFQREATSIARLRHPNIVQVYDFGASDNLTYMVMEYIAGPSLKQRIQTADDQRQRLPWPEVIAITRDIAAALDYAHQNNLVHRDIKPANILLRRAAFNPVKTTDPYAVLTDFGIVKMLAGVRFTATGLTLGTPDYMSPEQANGDDIGPASDIYALGVVVYEMLTGQLPFAADTPLTVLLKHVSEPPPSACALSPDLSPAVDEVLHQALAKVPQARFRSAGQLAAALEAAL